LQDAGNGACCFLGGPGGSDRKSDYQKANKSAAQARSLHGKSLSEAGSCGGGGKSVGSQMVREMLSRFHAPPTDKMDQRERRRIMATSLAKADEVIDLTLGDALAAAR